MCRLAVFYAVLAGLGEEALSVHSFERGNALDALSAAHWLGSGSSLGDALGRCPRRALGSCSDGGQRRTRRGDWSGFRDSWASVGLPTALCPSSSGRGSREGASEGTPCTYSASLGRASVDRCGRCRWHVGSSQLWGTWRVANVTGWLLIALMWLVALLSGWAVKTGVR